MKKYDVILVGSGMVGATVLLLLRSAIKSGLKVAVVEPNPFHPTNTDSKKTSPSFDDRSTALSKSTIDIFNSLGVWQPGLGSSIRKVDVSSQGSLHHSTLAADLWGIEDLGRVVTNKSLGMMLFAGLQDVAVDWYLGFEALSANATTDGYLLDILGRTANQETDSNHLSAPEGTGIEVGRHPKQSLFTQCLLLADGAPSRLAKTLGIQFDIFEYQQRALIANIEFKEPHLGVAYERFTKQGPMAILPLEDRCAALVWTGSEAQTHERMEMSDQQFAVSLNKAFGSRLGLVTRVGERMAYPLRKIVAQEQVRRGLVLVGNAAHLLHPVAGQGFNLSVRDVTTLVAVLEQQWQKNSLGDLTELLQWQKERHTDQSVIITASHLLPELFSRQSSSFFDLAKNQAAEKALTLLDLAPWLKKEFGQWAMGLTSLQKSQRSAS